MSVTKTVLCGRQWTSSPGVLATGDSLDELRESLQEGIALVLERDGVLPAVMIALLHPEPVAMTASAELVYA